VVEQHDADQCLQQIVGKRHPASQRDGRETLAPALVADSAHDRRDVEDHDRDAADDVARGREDAPHARFHRIRSHRPPDHERASANQADAKRPPLDAPNERQLRSDVLEEAMPAEQQAEQHCREELDVTRNHAEPHRVLVESDHRLRAAPGGVQEIAVSEGGVVRRNRLLGDSDDRLDVLRFRGHDPDRADDGRIQQASDDQGDDCAIRQTVQSQQ